MISGRVPRILNEAPKIDRMGVTANEKEAVQPCKIVSRDNESNDGWGCSGRLKRLVVRPALGF